jgi:hypothetical protein
LIFDVLDGSGQQAELVALGIPEYHPTDVRALANVCAPRAEGEQALELLGSGHAVSPQVEMQPVLDGLEPLRTGGLLRQRDEVQVVLVPVVLDAVGQQHDALGVQRLDGAFIVADQHDGSGVVA